MAYTKPTLKQLVDQTRTSYQSKISGAVNLLRRSTLKVMATVLAGIAHQLYGYLDFQSDQLFISSADSERLNEIADEYGIVRTATVEATGQGQATGTNGITIPAGTELRASSGQKYDTDEDVTIAGGVATLEFTAQVAGADGNDDGGITLTFVSPIAGVNSTVTVSADGITGGADEEEDDPLRTRILARKRQPAPTSTATNYEDWALEVSGVTRTWVIPGYQGVGTLAITFVMDNDTPIVPDATKLAEVRSYIVEHTDPATGRTIGVPVCVGPGLFVIEPQLLAVDFEIAIYPHNDATVEAAVRNELTALLLRKGGPSRTIYLSEIDEAISMASGEKRHRLVSPVADVTAGINQVHTLGTVTFTVF